MQLWKDPQDVKESSPKGATIRVQDARKNAQEKAQANAQHVVGHERLLAQDIWGLGCFSGSGTHCGVAINSVLLATIVGFGTFAVKNRKARMGRNPQTNEPMQIKASRTVGFRPGVTLKDSV